MIHFVNTSLIRCSVLTLLVTLCCSAAATVYNDTDLLDFHGTPSNNSDRSLNIFFDAGAWHGYSLPPAGESESGFVGPFIHSLGKGQWAGDRVAHLKLRDVDHQRYLALAVSVSQAEPGYLQRVFVGDDVEVLQTLFFPDSWHAVVRTEINSAVPRRIALQSEATLLRSTRMKTQVRGDHVEQKFPGSGSVLSTRLVADGYTGKILDVTPSGFVLTLDRPLDVKPGEHVVVYTEQTLVSDDRVDHPVPVDYSSAWNTNRARWTDYFSHIASVHLKGLSDQDAHHVAAKAVVTLIGNWRAARGDLLHDGVLPSYSDVNYNGFWAWDSWKHVAALAPIAPELARSQMLAMFDYQDQYGMIPDCIFMQKSNNNSRDSKPPLAGWAALRLYHATKDAGFLAQIYDRLERYHRWWAAERDHDHQGLAEYGSTDGTLIAAAWESGMDNAVRFDDTTMIQNGPHAWSADQISVDLNAYLYNEKRALAEIAGILGKETAQVQWLKEAEQLKHRIQTQLFDSDRGYFFDHKLRNGAAVHVYGPEGWIPLWAGVASKEQAQQVGSVMLDAKKFATNMPFPSLAADDPRFSPVTGYWRGAVWIDQAYFAIAGLHRYGFDQAADDMALRLVSNARGLTTHTPFHEVYDPLTGTGLHAPNFSWSAAHFLMLLSE